MTPENESVEAPAPTITLLGHLELRVEGRAVDLRGPQPRLVLAMLAVARGRSVSTDTIVDALWGDAPPASAVGTLQSYISRLRRSLEPSRGANRAPSILVSDPAGYRLVVEADQVDFRRFEQLADRGASLLDQDDPAAARQVLGEALALWRGAALSEFADREFALGPAIRLEERRMVALEHRIEADLRLRRHAELVGELGELVAEHPLREGLRAHLALALYRSGRQGDALRAIDDARATLREQLGVDPGRALRELDAAILAQDPSLDVESHTAPESAPEPAAAPPPAAPPPTEVRRSSPSGFGTGLVGRTTEMATVLDALDALTATSAIVIVEGEPGIGKTRLLEEVQAEAEARGATVTWGRSFEGGAAPAFWPWLSAWRSLLERATDVTSAVPPQLAVLLDPTTTVVGAPPSGAARFELFEGVALLLERLAEERPMVVILDDLQWADTASLELLSFVAERVSAPGVLLVGALREVAFDRSATVVDALAAISRRPESIRLQLEGLDVEDTARLLELTTRREVTDTVARAIRDRSDGNPFYATELARLLAAETDERTTATDTGDASPIPSNVRDVVRRRLVLLPPSTIELLQLAAIIGRDFDLDVLTRASSRPLDECLDDLDVALEQHLLVVAPDRPSTFRFAHALVREVIVDDLSPLRRARHHLRVADAIEAIGAGDSDMAEILAEHLLAAAPVGTRSRAAEALVTASDVAVRRYAFESAEEALERAVELWQGGSDPHDEQAELDALARLVMLRRAVHGYAAAAATLDRAKALAERLGRTHLLVHLLWTEWADEDTACRLERSAAIAHSLLELGESTGDPLIQMAGHGTVGIAAWHVGEMHTAARELDRAVELGAEVPMSEAPLAFELELRLMSKAFQLYVHEMIGDGTAGEDDFIALSKGQVDPFATGIVAAFTSVAGLALGDWHRLERAAEHGLALDPDARFTFWGSSLTMAQAIARLNLHTNDGGTIGQFETALARYVGSGANTSRPSYLANFALGAAGVGDVERATAAVVEAYDVIEKYGERCFEPLVLLADAVTRAISGAPPDDVAGLLSRGAALADRQGSSAVAARIRAQGEQLGFAPVDEESGQSS